MKVTLYDFEHRGEGTYFSCYVPTRLNLNEFGNLTSGDLLINDCRMISRAQQKKIYAMLGDISDYTGHHVEFLKSYMKSEYIAMYGGDWFSLGYVDMTTARKFIEFILHVCFEWDVPLKDKTVVLAKEVNNYLYLCLRYRRCAVCGHHADVHHVDAVGSGRNRNKVDHTKLRMIALCREHHQETHTIGWLTFRSKYHVEGILLHEKSLKELGLCKKNGEI